MLVTIIILSPKPLTSITLPFSPSWHQKVNSQGNRNLWCIAQSAHLFKRDMQQQVEMSCRSTCENVMKVLRNNKDSVMAMLEAFVHDPLINWRLLNTTDTVPETATSRDADSNKDLGDFLHFCFALAPISGLESTRIKSSLCRQRFPRAHVFP